MAGRGSSKCKIEEGRRICRGVYVIAESADTGERQSTHAENTGSKVASKAEKGSENSVNSEPETTAPDGGWGWVIVLASFFIQLIGGGGLDE